MYLPYGKIAFEKSIYLEIWYLEVSKILQKWKNPVECIGSQNKLVIISTGLFTYFLRV